MRLGNNAFVFQEDLCKVKIKTKYDISQACTWPPVWSTPSIVSPVYLQYLHMRLTITPGRGSHPLFTISVSIFCSAGLEIPNFRASKLLFLFLFQPMYHHPTTLSFHNLKAPHFIKSPKERQKKSKLFSPCIGYLRCRVSICILLAAQFQYDLLHSPACITIGCCNNPHPCHHYHFHPIRGSSISLFLFFLSLPACDGMLNECLNCIFCLRCTLHPMAMLIIGHKLGIESVNGWDVQRRGLGRQNGIGEDEVLSECLEQYIKHLQCFFLFLALLYLFSAAVPVNSREHWSASRLSKWSGARRSACCLWTDELDALLSCWHSCQDVQTI